MREAKQSNENAPSRTRGPAAAPGESRLRLRFGRRVVALPFPAFDRRVPLFAAAALFVITSSYVWFQMGDYWRG